MIWCRYIAKIGDELFVSDQAVFDCGQLRLRERDFLPQLQEIRFGFEHLRACGLFGHIERALRTRHAVRALIEEVVGAVAVAEIEELPRFFSSQSLANNVLVDQHFDGADIPLEVTGLFVGFGQLRRVDLRVVLR